MAYEIEIGTLRCRDAQEAEDEPYLKVNGRTVWTPPDMRTGDWERPVRLRERFDHDLTVELWERDGRRDDESDSSNDDLIGSRTLSERQIEDVITNADQWEPFRFSRDRGIGGDATYTLSYVIHRTAEDPKLDTW